MTGAAPPLVELRHVSKRYGRSLDLAERIANALGADYRAEVVHAVDDVSLSIEEGEVVGLAGESGCGKSTLGRVIAGIHKPSDGVTLHRGVVRNKQDALTSKRARLRTQMIFQDPYASLNPRMRVRDIVLEAPLVHGMVTRKDGEAYLDDVLRRCGLDPSYKRRFPHQFSGGQRQRIGIARALAVKPDLLVCDEAVAALDVSIQAQILNLFMKLRQDLGLTFLFISHDLGVVQHFSDRVVIMYLGRVVETAATEELFRQPNHPYTRALLSEVPRLDSRHRTFAPVKGEIPSALAPPSGCHFHPRCPYAMPRCVAERPPLREIFPGHTSACHLNDVQDGAIAAPAGSAVLRGRAAFPKTDSIPQTEKAQP